MKGLWCVLLCALVPVDAESKLPDESRVSYQETFPGTRNKAAFRLPGFRDVLASLASTEYINVGMKWNVVESKAAMAYATRLSAGHAPIPLETDDYHIEAFSKPASPAPGEHTKLRFRQKGVYSGTIGYAESVLRADGDQLKGEFVVWDNKAKALARLKAGALEVARGAVIQGDLQLKGRLVGETLYSKGEADLAGLVIGSIPAGSTVSALPGKSLGLYTTPAGATFDPKTPRVFVGPGGNVGVGTIHPAGMLHVKGTWDKVAVRVEAGALSLSGSSEIIVDSQFQGAAPTAGGRLRVTSEGYVGIANPAPKSSLDVGGCTHIDSKLQLPHADTKATLFVNNGLKECALHALRVKEALFVTSCDRVGVRTSTPETDFHVNGATKTTSLVVDKDVNAAGTVHAGQVSVTGKITSTALQVDKDALLKGKVEVEKDMIVKGDLWIGGEMKMLGGKEDRIALIEESHAQLHEHNKDLHARIDQLEELIRTMQKQS